MGVGVLAAIAALIGSFVAPRTNLELVRGPRVNIIRITVGSMVLLSKRILVGDHANQVQFQCGRRCVEQFKKLVRKDTISYFSAPGRNTSHIGDGAPWIAWEKNRFATAAFRWNVIIHYVRHVRIWPDGNDLAVPVVVGGCLSNHINSYTPCGTFPDGKIFDIRRARIYIRAKLMVGGVLGDAVGAQGGFEGGGASLLSVLQSVFRIDARPNEGIFRFAFGGLGSPFAIFASNESFAPSLDKRLVENDVSAEGKSGSGHDNPNREPFTICALSIASLLLLFIGNKLILNAVKRADKFHVIFVMLAAPTILAGLAILLGVFGVWSDIFMIPDHG